MNEERWHIIFTGRVQSVGFRFRSKYAADALSLRGWVQNLWDGSVEMEVQRLKEDIQSMISAIQTSSYIQIEDVISKQVPLENDSGFYIR